MKAVLFGLLMTSSPPIPATDFPSKISCKALGSWSCNPDGDCIDSTRIKGQRLKFDVRKMTFKGDLGTGRIAGTSRDEKGYKTLVLDDGRLFTLDAKHVGKLMTSTLGTSKGFAELVCSHARR